MPRVGQKIVKPELPKVKLLVSGVRFGRLTVLARGAGKPILCRCDCGVEKTFLSGNLLRGASKSCGCLRNEMTVERSTKHGHSAGNRSHAYRAWCSLRNRCTNSKSPDWNLYGGRGVTFAAQWKDFETFLSDVGEPPSTKHSMDRWPNMNGNYEPGNVRWATSKEQARNTRKNVFIEYGGERLTLAEWAERVNIDYHCLHYRYSQGWTPEDILLTPSKRKL